MKVENDWLKKVRAFPVKYRRAMIGKAEPKMKITKQCELLGIHRSGTYYKPRTSSEIDLELMEHIDKLHVKDPTLGTRRMALMLQRLGYKAGRVHVRTLIIKMRIKVIYCRPRTTISEPTKYKYPYLLSNLQITRPNQVWSKDITYIPMKKGFMYMTAIIDLYSRYILS